MNSNENLSMKSEIENNELENQVAPTESASDGKIDEYEEEEEPSTLPEELDLTEAPEIPDVYIKTLITSIKLAYGVSIEIKKEFLVYPELFTKYLMEHHSILSKKDREQIEVQISKLADKFRGTSYKGFLIPDGYKMTKNGGISVEIKSKKKESDEKEKTVPYKNICSYPAYIDAIFESISDDDNDDDNKFIFLRLKITNFDGTETTLVVTKETIYTSTGIKSLAKHNLDVTDKYYKEVAEFFRKFVRLNIDKFEKSYFAVRNGWNSNFTKYVNGDRVYYKGGFENTHIADDVRKDMMEGLGRKGNINEYEKLMQPIFNEEIFRFVASVVSTAPILKIIDAKNVILGLKGKTTRGKTFICRCGLSLFGFAPEEGGLVHTAKTSATNAEITANLFNNFPVFFDERMGNTKNYITLSELIYLLSNGIGKETATKQRKKATVNKFSNSFLITGEIDLTDKNGNDGQKIRVITLHVKKGDIPIFDVETFNRVKLAITEHYGNFTETYMEVLFEHMDKFREMYIKYQKCFSKLTENLIHTRQAEFFSSIMIGAFLFEETLKRLNEKYGTTFEIMRYEDYIIKYFNKCVIENETELSAKVTANQFYDWAHSESSNLFSTKILDKSSHCGFLLDKYIYVYKTKLEEFFKKQGREDSIEDVLEGWAEENIIKKCKRGDSYKNFGQHNPVINDNKIGGTLVCVKIAELEKFLDHYKSDDFVKYDDGVTIDKEEVEKNRPKLKSYFDKSVEVAN